MEYKAGINELMRKAITVLTLLAATKLASGQANLVPNPSFEEYDFCSTYAQGSGWADDWIVPDQGLTPNYNNSCSGVSALSVPDSNYGYQYARTGSAYVGLYAFHLNDPNTKEFVTSELSDSLRSGERYVFRAYFSLADDVTYSVRRMGYLLTDSLPSGPGPLYEVTPTFYNDEPGILDDKVNWVMLTDTVTAAGGERFLTIGGFFSDSLIDTLYVGNGIKTYAYYYVDDVSLIPLDTLLSVGHHGQLSVELYPNPAAGAVTLRSRERLSGAWLTELSGRRLRALKRRSGVLWETDVGSLPDGIYLIEAIAEDGRRAVRKVVKAP